MMGHKLPIKWTFTNGNQLLQMVVVGLGVQVFAYMGEVIDLTSTRNFAFSTVFPNWEIILDE